MKRRTGLQEEDEGDDINIKLLTSPRLPLSTSQENSTTTIATIANIDEGTTTTTQTTTTPQTTTTTTTRQATSSNLEVGNVNNYRNDEKGVATETTQKIKQSHHIPERRILQGYEGRKVDAWSDDDHDDDENSIASVVSISDRPGAFAVQGSRTNSNNNNDTAMEDGTVQYSMIVVPEETISQIPVDAGTIPINDPLEAERVLEIAQGTSIALHQNDDSQKWKQVTIVLSIFVFILCIAAAGLIIFFVRFNKTDNSLPSLSTTISPPVVATITSPSPTVYNPTLGPSTTISSAAPISLSVQQQMMTLLFEYLPDLPASNGQQQALNWIMNDPISLGIIREEGGTTTTTTRNHKRLLLERFVLATIYYATNGIRWRNNNQWLSETFVCQWHGIECQSDATIEQREVIYLDLADNQLTGVIPTELGLMTSMTALYLYENFLTGSIPTQVGLMTNMVHLELEINALVGSIPTEVGLMTSLTELWLDENTLTGSIPTEIGLMTNMVDLELANNNLIGSIPIQVGLMTSMTIFNVAKNALTGPIPTEVGLMTSMSRLTLHNNALKGPIPTEVGLMTRLVWLYLHNNLLTGSIPKEIGTLIRLTGLSISNNSDLSGTIPSEVVAILPNIQFCYMGNTNLMDIPENCLETFSS